MMMKFVFFLALACLVNVGSCKYQVTLNQGELLGTERETINGRKVAAFLGVPYAKPPQRFQKSEPAESWKGVWNASTIHSDCMMYSQGTYRYDPKHAVYGVEDCLYLDVYTPRLPKTGDEPLMDVVVYIHGGAFMFLYGGHHGPRYLLDRHDIVLVHINYRVGILGFLSTGDDVLPGNNGLKDQALALKWVQENIAKFGGNPKSVMVTGTSAGGASTHYHYLSPMSKGLFAKGHSMSGSTFVPWCLVEPTEAKERSQKLGELMGCPTSSSKELVDCLKERPARDLVMKTKDFLKWYYNPFTTFGPVVEPEGQDRFISEHPYEIIKSGKVQDLPWITSFTLDEGLYPAAETVGIKSARRELNDNWNEIAPHLFFYSHTSPESKWNEISQKIKDHYFDGRGRIDMNVEKIIQSHGDRFFTAYIVNSAKLQASVTKSPIYTYQFSYRGVHSASEALAGGLDNDWGTSHGDDTGYIYERNDMNPEETEQDKQMTIQLVDMIANFAKTSEAKFGDIKWDTVSSKSPDFTYLDIQGPNRAEVLTEPDVGNEQFWLSLELNELDKY